MPKRRNLIVFFIPPNKLVNGGILSIFSIARETRAYKDIHGAEVVLCTYPGTKSYKKNDLFKNDEIIYSFDELVADGSPDKLLFHIPEYASYNVYMSIKKYHPYIKGVKDFRVNIMTQNILLVQPPHEVALWFTLTPYLTQTTAHDKYTNQALANTYDTPVKHLSTFIDASQYQWTDYNHKAKVIALSPDERAERAGIVALLEKEFPDYSIVTIQNLSYEEYKKFISTAKFTITFGEGFDGYYVEPFFSGGISLAVYNEEFFPDKEFSTYQNVFSSYKAMQQDLVNTIKKLDNKSSYEKVVTENLTKINKLYNFKTYQNNIKQFYLGNYSYVPQPKSAERLIGTVITHSQTIIAQQESLLKERDQAIKEMAVMIEDKEAARQALNDKLVQIETSASWKLTKPLRKTSAIIKR